MKQARERAAKEARPDADAALTSSAAVVPDVVQAALKRMVVEGTLEAVEGAVGEGVNAGQIVKRMGVATTEVTRGIRSGE